MKRAAHIHHRSIVEVRANSPELRAQPYSIKYVASPGKTYLVNPTDGEIDYSKAAKNYDKFYEEVANQKITKFRM